MASLSAALRAIHSYDFLRARGLLQNVNADASTRLRALQGLCRSPEYVLYKTFSSVHRDLLQLLEYLTNGLPHGEVAFLHDCATFVFFHRHMWRSSLSMQMQLVDTLLRLTGKHYLTPKTLTGVAQRSHIRGKLSGREYAEFIWQVGQRVELDTDRADTAVRCLKWTEEHHTRPSDDVMKCILLLSPDTFIYGNIQAKYLLQHDLWQTMRAARAAQARWLKPIESNGASEKMVTAMSAPHHRWVWLVLLRGGKNCGGLSRGKGLTQDERELILRLLKPWFGDYLTDAKDLTV